MNDAVTGNMDALQNNVVLIFSLLGLAEWAILASVSTLLFLQLYRRKAKQLRTLQAQQKAPAASAPPDLKALLQKLINQTEHQLFRSNEEQTTLLQARVAFLQSEIIAADLDISPEYWEDMCLRLSSILPQNEAVSPADDEDVSQEAAAELLEVPDYLDEFNLAQPAQDDYDESDISGPDGYEVDDVTEISQQSPLQELDALDIIDDGDNDNINIAKIRGNLQKQSSALATIKSLTKSHSINENGGFRQSLEQVEVSNAHIRLALNNLAKEFAEYQQHLDSQAQELQAAIANAELTGETPALNDSTDELQQTIDDLQQQVEDRELVILQLQSELEALRSQILHLQSQLETAPPPSAPSDARVFHESGDPEELTHQIESLTDLLVQKSEQLASLQSDLPLPEDAFESEDAMHHALAQQEHNQALLPELDDIVHPSEVSASYELTPEQEAMIEEIEDIDLSIDDDSGEFSFDIDNDDPPLSSTG